MCTFVLWIYVKVLNFYFFNKSALHIKVVIKVKYKKTEICHSKSIKTLHNVEYVLCVKQTEHSTAMHIPVQKLLVFVIMYKYKLATWEKCCLAYNKMNVFMFWAAARDFKAGLHQSKVMTAVSVTVRKAMNTWQVIKAVVVRVLTTGALWCTP